jgi:hypothetical protein
MTGHRIRGSVLLGGALLIATVTACTPGPAGAAAAPTGPTHTPAPVTTTSAPVTSDPATTVVPPATTTAPPVSTGAATHPTTTASRRTVIYTCGRRAVSKPATLDVTCADSNMNLLGLHWTGWGGPTTHATGTLLENNCTPDCATGTDIRYRASVTLNGFTHGQYTRMRIAAPSAPEQPYDFTLTKAGPA